MSKLQSLKTFSIVYLFSGVIIGEKNALNVSFCY